jgi:hypothetical protein
MHVCLKLILMTLSLGKLDLTATAGKKVKDDGGRVKG